MAEESWQHLTWAPYMVFTRAQGEAPLGLSSSVPDKWAAMGK